VEKWVHSVSGALNWVSMAVIIIMVLTVTVDVGGAYLFRKPLTGSIDLVELMMVVAVFLAFAYCTSIEGNVRVDVLYSHLPGRLRAGLDVFTYAASLYIMVVITWRIADRAWNVMHNPPGPATGTLMLPHLPFIWLASAGCLLLCLELLIVIVRAIPRIRSGE
jgi:TRAP-type C4-dicarboxylate transport system permease small subunit